MSREESLLCLLVSNIWYIDIQHLDEQIFEFANPSLVTIFFNINDTKQASSQPANLPYLQKLRFQPVLYNWSTLLSSIVLIKIHISHTNTFTNWFKTFDLASKTQKELREQLGQRLCFPMFRLKNKTVAKKCVFYKIRQIIVREQMSDACCSHQSAVVPPCHGKWLPALHPDLTCSFAFGWPQSGLHACLRLINLPLVLFSLFLRVPSSPALHISFTYRKSNRNEKKGKQICFSYSLSF